ncbi:MAG TPA: CoA pyrophosphatase [Dehalococcoidia bacterium]|nr:CoA pyrophosphatase [Dehalococcoidia bacterium]
MTRPIERDQILRALREKPEANRLPLGTPAGVVLLLYGEGRDDRIIYTVRTSLVEHHKGEVSFPGGMRDEEDESLRHTALREAHEEIGVDPADVEIVGELDEILTRKSNFVITPFVGVIPYPYEFRPNPHEVEEVLAVPISHLLDRRNVEADPDFGYHYRYQHHVIWGATARITTEFLDLIAPDR